eukprot:jgi/Mesvir1/21264/Mv21665-RA.1
MEVSVADQVGPPADDCSNDAAIAAALGGPLDKTREALIGDDAAIASALHQGEVEDEELSSIRRSNCHLDSLLDSAVASCLGHVPSIRVTPKINGPVPPLDQAEVARARLQERLFFYGLREVVVSGDGNCQFAAVSDQLYRTPTNHRAVRSAVVKQLKQHPAQFSGYIPGDYHAYVRDMSRSGTWGDHITLQAVADVFGVRLNVLTSFEEAALIEIAPKEQHSQRGQCAFIDYARALAHFPGLCRGHVPIKSLVASCIGRSWQVITVWFAIGSYVMWEVPRSQPLSLKPYKLLSVDAAASCRPEHDRREFPVTNPRVMPPYKIEARCRRL